MYTETAERLLQKMAHAMSTTQPLAELRTVELKYALTLGSLSGTMTAAIDLQNFHSLESFDLGAFHQTNGYDGNSLWTKDMNGKLMLNADTEAVAASLQRKAFDWWRYLSQPDEYVFALDETETSFRLRVESVAHAGKPYAATTLTVEKSTFRIVAEETLTDGFPSSTEYSEFAEYDGITLPALIVSKATDQDEQRLRVTHVRLNTELDARRFTPPADIKDYRFPEGATRVAVPLHIPLDHLYADVIIANKKYRFGVDTGAGKTVLSKTLVDELALEVLSEIQGQGVGGSQPFFIVAVPSLKVGELELTGQQVLAMDFTELHKALPEMSGILGMDFLNRFVVTLDYVKREMELIERDGFGYQGAGEIFLLDSINIAASLDAHEGKFRIDTGAGGVALHTPFAVQHGLLTHKNRLPRTSKISGAGNAELVTYKALCRNLRLGHTELTGVPVEIAETDVGAFASASLAGNLGGSVWRKFICTFDFTGNRMWLEPNSNLAEPYRLDKAGISITAENGKRTVRAVTTHSPAFDAGVMKGDEVMEINGTPASKLSPEQFAERFSAPEGAVVRLKLRAPSGETRDVSLTLAVYQTHYEGF